MSRIQASHAALLFVLVSSGSAQQQAKRTEFAPGQVWRSDGVAGEAAVHFVVLETGAFLTWDQWSASA